MNTTFFDKVSDISRNFSWKDIFSDVFQPHTKEQRDRLLIRGMANRDVRASEMLNQWQKPWFFFRVGVAACMISLFCLAAWTVFPTPSTLMLLIVLPAFVIPIAILFFFWEMNIPGDISIFEMFLYMLIGGIASIMVTGVVHYFITFSDTAYIAGPLPEELAKFVIVWILLSRNKHCYGIQGILVGACVGAGFAAMESAGYAYNYMGNDVASYSANIAQIQILRGVLSVGGHTVWASLYGGALALAKGRGRMQASLLMDPLVMAAFSGAFLLHTAWNFMSSVTSPEFAAVFPQQLLIVLYKMNTLYISQIILILLAWAFLLMIMRISIREVVEVSERAAASERISVPAGSRNHAGGRSQSAPVSRVLLTVSAAGQLNTGQSYQLYEGRSLVFGRDPERANVVFPAETKGVSAVHCEIKQKEGYLVLIDRESSYGTFFSNGERLEPNVPYKLQDRTEFYLAAQENRFMINM